jgi:hypothetical protein
MRPGEKLYEELFFNEENATPTEHEKVLRARNAALNVTGAYSAEALIALARSNAPADDLRRCIQVLVPEYTGGPDGPREAAPRPAPKSYQAPRREEVREPQGIPAAAAAAFGRTHS